MRKIPLSKLPTPRELAASLYGSGEFVVLLESGMGYAERSRYTLVAWGVEEEYVSYGVDLQRVLERAYGALSKYPSPLGGDVVVGFLTYDAAAYIEPVLLKYGKVERGAPAAVFVKPRGYLLYDKLLGRAYLAGEDPPAVSKSRGGVEVRRFAGGTDHLAFMKWVAEARSRIRDGEAFQIVLSRYEDYIVEGDLFTLYERLADVSPTPYMYFMYWRDVAIFGASPELLVKTVGDRVETHPIAGTRPRGATEEEDLALEEDMLRDEKELAEHIMLVDLARNDLGRVCRPGTVKVDELYAVEKYSRVQHIVSRVSCVMEKKYTPVDALLAAHPAGTVTGAPKVRAMEIVAELEETPRWVYAGALGFFAPALSEFAIVIRSAVAREGVLRIQAGAGVVYDSTPERELKETQTKLKALREALGVWT